jgi:hypothetical protein
MQYPKQYTLMTRVFYDQYNQCYKNIVTINMMPEGPLKDFVIRLQYPRLSEFQVEGPCYKIPKCGLALRSFSNNCCNNNLMTPNDIPNLFSFLSANGYHIDTSLTHMMNTSDVKLTTERIICFVSYIGE